MAYQESCKSISVVAGSTVAAGRFLVGASDGQYDHAGTAQTIVDGISGMAGSAGETIPMTVPDGGIALVTAGDTITVGALIATDNVGRAIPAGTTAGDIAIGRAVTAGVVGNTISIQFTHKRTAAGS